MNALTAGSSTGVEVLSDKLKIGNEQKKQGVDGCIVKLVMAQ